MGSAVQAAEVFSVTCPELEEGGYGLTVGGLQAFKLQGVHGREVRRVGLVVGRDLVFGQTGRPPSVGAEAGAGTQSPSGDKGQAVGWGHWGLGMLKHLVSGHPLPENGTAPSWTLPNPSWSQTTA
jgi:hypothetical protein